MGAFGQVGNLTPSPILSHRFHKEPQLLQPSQVESRFFLRRRISHRYGWGLRAATQAAPQASDPQRKSTRRPGGLQVGMSKRF